MLIEQDAHQFTSGDGAVSAVSAAASRVVAGLPADQALGLRLIALAQAAAAIHMTAGVPVPPPSGQGLGRGLPAIGDLSASQARNLLAPTRAEARS